MTQLLIGLLLAAVHLPGMGQGSIYTCTDNKGNRLTSDRPLRECMDREQRELSPTGTLRRTIPPTPTAAERAAEEEKARKATEERERQAEEKRRERALVARYASRAEHDKERAAALQTVDAVAKSAQARATELQAQRQKLDEDTGFYRNDPAKYPAALRRQLEENDSNMASQKRFLLQQDEEKKRINQRFDDELEQLRRLWAQQATPAAVR
ncbi:DUF4124 domain-containing protein [uncultured Ramlibacter sp.]|uniref:DUF4124 domain-containing protein n=1 Tax=uncultured Ramlibacter sp. TaxID=260755 RepID=UPI002630FE06|nr:DUF4124 domain-containing protein [uncultured Ramlibacter sp.]